MAAPAKPSTSIEIISQAGVLCGKQGFSTIASGGAFAQDGQVFYDTFVAAELGSNRWRFAQASQAVSTLTTLTPSFDRWNYYWTLPADLLMLTSVDPFIDYIVFGDRLLTVSNQAITVLYTQSVEVSKWSAPFCLYAIYSIASMLAASVTNSDRMVARLQNDKEMWHSRALFADGQSTPTQSLRSSPWTTIRHAYRSGSGW